MVNGVDASSKRWEAQKPIRASEEKLSTVSTSIVELHEPSSKDVVTYMGEVNADDNGDSLRALYERVTDQKYGTLVGKRVSVEIINPDGSTQCGYLGKLFRIGMLGKQQLDISLGNGELYNQIKLKSPEDAGKLIKIQQVLI